MQREFTYDALPARVVFGPGRRASIGRELERMGVSRALVLSTPEQEALARDVAERIGARAAGLYTQARMHVPVEIAEEACKLAQDVRADVTVAVGGGSTTGLAKAIALKLPIPIVALPTTYAGSEMTPIWGLTEGGIKTTGRDLRVLPKLAIYDPELTLSLPVALSVTSGFNAIAHCAEALYAQDANPIISLVAEEGIRALAASLPVIVRSPAGPAARAEALYGAWLAGMSLGAVGMALHHKLCHTLGGTLNLPHAETHTVVLPFAIAYNRDAAPEAMRRVAKAIGAADAAQGLYDLSKSLGAPTSLAALGVKAEQLPMLAELATAKPYWNPRPPTREGILALLQDAHAGRRP
jgi:alcohol dehydrogenase class IV